MRIAFAVHDARQGGGQDRYALELVNRLANSHEVSLFARSAEGVSPSVRFRQIATPQRPGSLRARVFAHKVRHELAGERWDIIHTVGGALPGATVITAQYCQAGWKDAAAAWPSPLTGHLERAYRRLELRFAARTERAAASHASLRALIAVSRQTLAEWERAYSPLANVTAVIPNAVDTSRFTPIPEARGTLRNELNIPATNKVLLLIGALVRKGIETALETLAMLDTNITLLAVGVGPHQRVMRLATTLGVQDRTILCNPVGDIERYYQAADAFLFPTRYEPFGMVIAEAWASGLPVICARTAGALEWAEHGRNVLALNDPADAAAFAHETRRLFADDTLRTQLSRGGVELANTLTWERVTEETERVYRDACA